LAHPFYEPVVAFDGAMGYGANATGGRGDGTLGDTTLYLVTNLNDSGTGSLRAALEATGKRVIVPKVSGWVETADRIDPTSDFTFLGMLSPGGLGVRHDESPVTTAGSLIVLSNINNFILRFMAIRSDTVTSSTSNDALRISSCTNGIVDHISASYATDGVADTSYSNLITHQDCLYTYPLTGDPEGDHEYHMLSAPDAYNVTVARCLFNNARARVPEAGRGARQQWFGNTIYNCRQKFISPIYSGRPDSEYAYVKNYIKQGDPSWDPMSGSNLPVTFRNRHTGTIRRDTMYIEGNACPGVISDPTVWAQQENIVYIYSASDPVTDSSRDPAEWITDVPFSDMPTLAGEDDAVADIHSYVLTNAGNVLFRDSVDTATVNEVINDTGRNGTYSSGSAAGGWPAFSSTSYPTATDGVISDAWRTANSESRDWYELDTSGTGRMIIENYADDVANGIWVEP
jgi:hypothetical protein